MFFNLPCVINRDQCVLICIILQTKTIVYKIQNKKIRYDFNKTTKSWDKMTVNEATIGHVMAFYNKQNSYQLWDWNTKIRTIIVQ